MDRLAIDPATVLKLTSLQHSVELCDSSGKVVGWFQPTVTREEYEGLEPPFTEEELRAAQNEEGGRTLDEILADLERPK